MTDWVRLWHDMPSDPKWRTVARKSGQSVGNVIAVFTFVMCAASGNASERGSVPETFSAEDLASALDIDEADVSAILDAMQGRVMDGRKLTGWQKRQPKREDSTAAQRKAAWLERHKNAAERNGTHGNAPETETDTEEEKGTAIAVPKKNGRGARLPADWMPGALPAEIDPPPDLIAAELAKFRDYWAAQPGQKGVKTDWQATWRNWVRKAMEGQGHERHMGRGDRAGAGAPRRNPAWDMLRDAMGDGPPAPAQGHARPPASDSRTGFALPTFID